MTFVDLSVLFPSATCDLPAAELALDNACAEFDVTTHERVAAFLAQIHHETAGLTRFAESFAYSASRLMVVWPARFRTLAQAERVVALGPHGIASTVYAGRNGNGDFLSGDGWRYRGQGMIQLTGHANYREAGAALGIPLEDKPERAGQLPYMARIAAWFWQSRGCNELADRGDFRRITRAINGGYVGWTDRVATWNRFRALFGLDEWRNDATGVIA